MKVNFLQNTISLVISDIEHFFTYYLLVVWISSLEKCLCSSFVHFSVWLSSVAQLWHHVSTLCDTMDCSMSGFPVHHQHLEPTQTHDHHVSDATQPSHPLLSPSPLSFNLSQHQDLIQWVSYSHQAARVLELQLQHQSFQWISRTDFL